MNKKIQEIHVIYDSDYKWHISLGKSSTNFRSYKSKIIALLHAIIIGRQLNYSEVWAYSRSGSIKKIMTIRNN